MATKILNTTTANFEAAYEALGGSTEIISVVATNTSGNISVIYKELHEMAFKPTGSRVEDQPVSGLGAKNGINR